MRKSIVLISAIMMLAVSACCSDSKCDNGTACDTCGTCDSTEVSGATADEIAGIEKALNFYTEAAVKGDSKIAMQGFAPAATMSYADGDSLVTVPIQALYDYYDQSGPHNATYSIADISVANDVAMVRIESQFGEASFSDMFTLVKDGNDWKIVSKVYHVK